MTDIALGNVLESMCIELDMKYKPPGCFNDPRTKLSEEDEQLFRHIESCNIGYIEQHTKRISFIIYFLNEHFTEVVDV